MSDHMQETNSRLDRGVTAEPGHESEPGYEVVWPGSAMGVQAKRAAPRLETLENATVAFLWDYLFRGDELFPILEQELLRRFPGLTVVGYEEFGNTHGSDEVVRIAGLPEFLAEREVDAVVSGMGC